MIGGIIKFLFCLLAFWVVGVVAGPVWAAAFNGAAIPWWGILGMQLAAIGLILQK